MTAWQQKGCGTFHPARTTIIKSRQVCRPSVKVFKKHSNILKNVGMSDSENFDGEGALIWP